MASNRMTRAARVSRAVEAGGRPAVVAAPESPGSARHAHGSRVADLGDENIGRIKARNQHWGGATLKAPRVCAMSLVRTALGRALLARPVVARAAATRAYCAPTTLAEGAETEEGEFSQHTDAEVAFEVSEPTFMTTLTFSEAGIKAMIDRDIDREKVRAEAPPKTDAAPPTFASPRRSSALH